MRDPARIQRIIDKLHQLWRIQPDTRLCQLVINTAGEHPFDPYHLEDDQMEEAIDQAMARMEAVLVSRLFKD